MEKIPFKSRKRGSRFWIKGLLVLLAVMFLFTVISKAADSLTVAKVSVSSPTARKLQYTVSAEGRIEKNRELSVLTEPDILVKSVLVSEGQRVKKGDVLAKLDLVQLGEQMEQVSDEKRVLELQNQAIQKNRAQAEKEQRRQERLAKKRQRQQEKLSRKKQKQQVKRAKSDYQLLKKENKLALQQAEQEISKAQRELEKAQKRFSEKSEEKSKEAEVTEDMIVALQDAVTEKQSTYERLKVSIEQSEKKAKEAIQDAKSLTDEGTSVSEDALTDGGYTAGQEVDNSIDINNISIQKLDASLEKLREIERNQGKVLAPEDGVVTEILVNVGQKTLDTAMFTMTDDNAGLKFVGQVPKADAGRVSIGDLLTLRSANQKKEGIPVTSIEMDESGEFMNVTALLPAESFSLGETVQMSVTQESANYPCTVPLSAVYEDSGKYFVLLLLTEDTVLGEQETARKTEVKVLERNQMYAALEAGSLEADSRIIIDSNRYVETGDRVRLKEE